MLLGDVCLDQDDGAAGVSPVTVLRPYGDAALCMCPDPDPRGCRASGTLTPPVPAAKAPSFPGWNCPLPRRGPDSAWGRPHLVAWSRAPGAKTPAGLRPPPAPAGGRWPSTRKPARQWQRPRQGPRGARGDRCCEAASRPRPEGRPPSGARSPRAAGAGGGGFADLHPRRAPAFRRRGPVTLRCPPRGLPGPAGGGGRGEGAAGDGAPSRRQGRGPRGAGAPGLGLPAVRCAAREHPGLLVAPASRARPVPGPRPQRGCLRGGGLPGARRPPPPSGPGCPWSERGTAASPPPAPLRRLRRLGFHGPAAPRPGPSGAQPRPSPAPGDAAPTAAERERRRRGSRGEGRAAAGTRRPGSAVARRRRSSAEAVREREAAEGGGAAGRRAAAGTRAGRPRGGGRRPWHRRRGGTEGAGPGRRAQGRRPRRAPVMRESGQKRAGHPLAAGTCSRAETRGGGENASGSGGAGAVVAPSELSRISRTQWESSLLPAVTARRAERFSQRQPFRHAQVPGPREGPRGDVRGRVTVPREGPQV